MWSWISGGRQWLDIVVSAKKVKLPLLGAPHTAQPAKFIRKSPNVKFYSL